MSCPCCEDSPEPTPEELEQREANRWTPAANDAQQLIRDINNIYKQMFGVKN